MIHSQRACDNLCKKCLKKRYQCPFTATNYRLNCGPVHISCLHNRQKPYAYGYGCLDISGSQAIITAK